jgi:hypothetical protein
MLNSLHDAPMLRVLNRRVVHSLLDFQVLPKVALAEPHMLLVRK